MSARRRLGDGQLGLPGFRFPGNPGRILEAAIEGRIRLVLPKAVIAEARGVFRRKFPPQALAAFTHLLRGLPFESVSMPAKIQMRPYEASIADPNDLPVLVSAIHAQPDYVVSGDRHFHSAKIRALIPVVGARRLVEQLEL